MKKWWHNSTVYQIYPKSFNDSNGDGIGDIKGIIERLDYLKLLGVDILWISPIYKSPMDDNGYDISDYRDIAPEFGDMSDVELLINEANKRSMKIVMDLVVNHTSDEHRWFVESRKSKDNPYRDYYIWRDPVDGKEPNDIKSYFSGSAWEFDKETGQYYLHMFSKKQPDLNWDNERLRKEIFDMMNFWIDKGVSGFRMDVIDMIGKDIDRKNTGNTEKTHEYIKEMNKSTFGNKDLFTVGETGGATIERAKLFTNPKRQELDTVFQFQHVSLDEVTGKSKWDLSDLKLNELKEVLSKWQTELGDEGWNSIYWCNHDQPRIVSRWGNDKEYRIESAKMFATLLHFMKGIPYIYQGEELGMTNAYFNNIEDYRDIETINLYKERLELGYDKDEIIRSLKVKSRDNSRTPMQWNKEKNAGFTTGDPWIKVNKNYEKINAEIQINDPNSIFNYYKKLVNFRKENDIVVYGDYNLLMKNNKNIFAYTREYNGKQILVVCNFYGKQATFNLPKDIKVDRIDLIISNYQNSDLNRVDTIKLRPYEAFACFIK